MASVHGLAPGTRSRWIDLADQPEPREAGGVGRVRRDRHAVVGEIGPGGRRIGQVIVVGLLAAHAGVPVARRPVARVRDPQEVVEAQVRDEGDRGWAARPHPAHGRRLTQAAAWLLSG